MNGIALDTYFKAVRFISELDQRSEPNRKAGWVYVMRNSELQKPLLKIGMTRRPPDDRASEMGAGVPGKYELIYFVHVCDARSADRRPRPDFGAPA